MKGNIRVIDLRENILLQLSEKCEIKRDNITYLSGGREDNDGIVYTFQEQGKKKVLKIVAKENENSLDFLAQKLKFAYYLGENGIPIACPKRRCDSKIFQTVRDEKYIYLASVMDFVEGKSPDTKDLNPEVVKRWGCLTGAMHKATKKYSYWKNMPCSQTEWGYEDEINDFYEMCKYEEVRVKWNNMKKTLDSIQKNQDNYGMIHNDNHQNNILKQNDTITLIDFDCATCHFFLNDLLLPAQGILFDVSGGMHQPFRNMKALYEFYTNFLTGYETQNHVENDWINQMGIFLNYRRMLLFTVMQGWMDHDSAAREGFLQMMREPTDVKLWQDVIS